MLSFCAFCVLLGLTVSVALISKALGVQSISQRNCPIEPDAPASKFRQWDSFLVDSSSVPLRTSARTAYRRLSRRIEQLGDASTAVYRPLEELTVESADE